MSWSELQGRTLQAVFKVLTERKIPWLVLRNHQGLPWTNTSKDVDIGIEQHRFHETENIIYRVMKEHGFDRKETTVFQWGRCTSYFGVIDGDAISIKIDLMDGFSWRTAGLFDAARLIKRAVPHGDFLIPDPIDDATIMWLKPLMTGGFVKQTYVPGIVAGVSADPARFRSNLDRLFGKHFAENVWQHLKFGDFEALTTHHKRLSWNAWSREVSARPLQSLKNAFSYVFWELLRRVRRPRATILAVLGPDGVGKTTFINTLQGRLATLQAKEPETIEVSHFRPYLLPNLNQLLTGKTETVVDFNDPHSAPPAAMLSSFLRIGYYSLDYILGYWLKLRRRLISGRTIVFDRYFYDFIVDPRRSRLSLPSWAPKFILFFIPKPDLIFVLDASSAEIYRRKQELQRDEIERQLKAYRKLIDKDPSRFVRINASTTPDEMVDIALREIVVRLYRNI